MLSVIPGSAAHAAGIRERDRIYAVGGLTHVHEIEIYDPATDKWTRGAPLPRGVHHPAAVGLDTLGKHEGYIARQLKRWYGQWNAQKTRELPAVDRVHDELMKRIPDQGPATIVHGDYRLDNCMVDDAGNVIAVLDWELCTLGDPLADLGYIGIYWTDPGQQINRSNDPSGLAGFPRYDDLVERYARRTGRDVSNIDYYRAFQYWRLAAIVEGVMARSRFTLLPGASARRLVSRMVSGERSAAKVWSLMSSAVRQQPFTAMDAPSPEPCRTVVAPMRSRPPLRDCTRPSSSTIPVNIWGRD